MGLGVFTRFPALAVVLTTMYGNHNFYPAMGSIMRRESLITVPTDIVGIGGGICRPVHLPIFSFTGAVYQRDPEVLNGTQATMPPYPASIPPCACR